MSPRTADHRKRFERWRKGLPKQTAHLVEQVLTRIVPEFEARGFGWYSDYGGGDGLPNNIPLQLRQGEEWPTVEILFAKWGRPFFQINFATLPSVCKIAGRDPLPREKAGVVHAPAYFALRKGRGSSYQDGIFGREDYLNHCMTLIMHPQILFKHAKAGFSAPRFLDQEVSEAVTLVPILFELFENGIPAAWRERDKIGYVSKHVILLNSWKMSERRRATAASP